MIDYFLKERGNGTCREARSFKLMFDAVIHQMGADEREQTSDNNQLGEDGPRMADEQAPVSTEASAHSRK